jgi:type VI secretion system protein ImpM
MAIGVFGKYPGKRDFVAFGLPQAVLGPIEGWLQSALAASQNQLGGRWQDYYMVMPIWRFRIGSEITGSDCLGALMPSVDGVGRYFPLLITAIAEPGSAYPVFEHENQLDWFASIEQRLLSTLDENEVPEAATLCQNLEEAPSVIGETNNGGNLAIETLNKGFSLSASPDATVEAKDALSLSKIIETEALMASKSRSSWWTHGGEFVPAQYISSAGMPDPYHFVRMMGGP